MAYKPCGCPVIDRDEWEGRALDWTEKTFFFEKVRFLFNVAINLEQQGQRAAEQIDAAGYMLEEPMMTLIEEGRFSGGVYVAVVPPDRPDPHVVTLGSAPIHAMLYETKTPAIGPGVKAIRARLAKQGKKVVRVFVWHVTCPECSKNEGFKSLMLAQEA